MLSLIAYKADSHVKLSAIESQQDLVSVATALLNYTSPIELIELGDLSFVASGLSSCVRKRQGPWPAYQNIEHITGFLFHGSVPINHRFAFVHDQWHLFIDDKMVPAAFLVADVSSKESHR